MTDKEKVIQLLLDNGFELITGEYFKNNEMTVSITTDKVYSVTIFPIRGLEIITSYRELIGFLYLKYGKVYISEK